MKHKEIIIENLEIIDAGSEGKAVGKYNGLTVFVPYAVPGDIVTVKIYKKKKSFAESHIIEIVKPSPFRIAQMCEHFGLCGGCKWQSMHYSKQLFYKRKQVIDCFSHLGKFDFPEPNEIIASEKQTFYRNKLEFAFTNLRWMDSQDMIRQKEEKIETNGLGFHIPGKFDKVLDINRCYLQSELSNNIRLQLKKICIEKKYSFYNSRDHSGFMRNVIIRNSTLGDVMVIVVFGNNSSDIEFVLDFLSDSFPEITSLQYVVNEKVNDSIFDLIVQPYKGKSYMTEKMENLTFKIRPLSFFQTNYSQALKLYAAARKLANISNTDIVYDLYTGIGTIANFIASNAKKVIGIDYIDSAIEDARENSKINEITNTFFEVGDMAKIFTDILINKYGSPDVVITDPPRAGMHESVIEQLLKITPRKIVYVSCNPATQARDITILSEKYTVEEVQPVDMFPHTQHVENIALLKLKKN